MDLVKIIQNAKDINELKPLLYKHIFQIVQRNKLGEKYHLLFLYERNLSIKRGM